MKNYIQTLLIIPLFTFLFLAPLGIVQAATSTPDDGSTPITYTIIEASIATDPEVCNYLGSVFILLIGLAGVISVIVIVIGGIELVIGAANPSARNDAKDRIQGALIGLFIALIAWLLLNSINPALVSECYILTEATDATAVTAVVVPDMIPPVVTVDTPVEYLAVGEPFDSKEGVTSMDAVDGDLTSDILILGDPFTTNDIGGPYYIFYHSSDKSGNTSSSQKIVYVGFQPDYEDAAAPTYTGSGYTGTASGGGSLSGSSAEGVGENSSCEPDKYSPTETEARAQLSAGGVSVNKSACPCPSGGSGCTNVGGSPAIGQVVALKAACGCSVVVTGGTEPGHKSHGPGIPVIDLRKSTALNTYITTNGTSVSSAFGGYATYELDGGIYVNEGNHWHVMY